MFEHQRTVWAILSTVSSAYNFTMQELTPRSYATSIQHKELSASQVRRDETDLGKVAEQLDSFKPFSGDESLHNIITGINANEDVNVQDLFKIGKDIVQKMDGQSVLSYSHKRSLKAKTLASSKNVKVSADCSMSATICFQINHPRWRRHNLLILLLFHAYVSKCTALYTLTRQNPTSTI